MERFDAIVIGGGPAGLFSAIHCRNPGRRILLLEKMRRCGNKLLLTGSGQCNITHDGGIGTFISRYGTHGAFVKPALYQFPNTDLCSYFTERGVMLAPEPSGKVFPASRRSRDILACLCHDLRSAGIDLRTNEPVIRLRHRESTFCIETPSGQYESGAVIIATGGKTYPRTGSSGDGYLLAESLGHTIQRPHPALAPVAIRDYPFPDLAGISFPGCRFSLRRGGRKMADCHGDVLLTHDGLSGPGILDNSRLMEEGDELRMSWISKPDPGSVEHDFSSTIRRSGQKRPVSLLTPYHLPGRFARRILEISGISPDISCAQLTARELNRLVTALTSCPLTIRSVGDFSVAMVTRGGVSLAEVNAKTMESRLCPGLHFAGEVLDVDGDTGGYNLQAAFSTGWLAARHIRTMWEQEKRSPDR